MKKILFAALATAGILFATGQANAAIHKDGHGGAVCKGETSCLFLSIECKGKYIDATQPDGTVYGKCTKVSTRTPSLKAK